MPEHAAAWTNYLAPLGVAAAGLIVGWIVQRILLAHLVRLAERTRSKYDDVVLHALRGPVALWCFLLGIYVAVSIAPLPEKIVFVAGRALTAALLLSVTWVLARIAGGLVQTFTEVTGEGIARSSLFSNVSRLVVFSVGLLVTLQTLGVSVTPVLTALGVGGLAVALALQDTLSNLFAGIQLLAAKQIRVGDFIRLETSEEGHVTDITWRNTTIRMLSNSLVVIPNSKLSSATVVNYSLPDRESSVLAQVGVSYDADLEKVERVTIEVAARIMREVPGGVPEFAPLIRYHTLGESSVSFTVVMRAREIVDQYLIKHEFLKALRLRYREEGIEIPFPVRTVHLKDQR